MLRHCLLSESAVWRLNLCCLVACLSIRTTAKYLLVRRCLLRVVLLSSYHKSSDVKVILITLTGSPNL